jgi:hypothetical protein
MVRGIRLVMALWLTGCAAPTPAPVASPPPASPPIIDCTGHVERYRQASPAEQATTANAALDCELERLAALRAQGAQGEAFIRGELYPLRDVTGCIIDSDTVTLEVLRWCERGATLWLAAPEADEYARRQVVMNLEPALNVAAFMYLGDPAARALYDRMCQLYLGVQGESLREVFAVCEHAPR